MPGRAVGLSIMVALLTGSAIFYLGSNNGAPGMGGTQTLSSPTDPDTTSSVTRDAALAKLVSQVGEMTFRMQELEARVSRFEQELKETSNVKLPAQAAARSEADDAGPVPRRDSDQFLELADSNVQDAAIENEIYARQQQFHFLGNQLMYEPVDEGWVQSMDELFIALQDRISAFGLTTTKLTYSVCRSTMCKAEFVHGNEQEQYLTAKLLALKGTSGVSLNYQRGANGESVKTIAFFAREGHQLPEFPTL